ncbi:hypothetical protein [Nonomuraea rhodomycinica]|uniref:DUF3558 domain-containing protein n=1 Tax=Nonomuraea rhodomycinica TaxID=1712872 RepID=A0A7Y6IL82_9ACTN|nr:hypothetical protein [Nonomuraea rhodomycinica]NUW40211.1 hypothetical protein [Nonomuraea rhodomycinica]
MRIPSAAGSVLVVLALAAGCSAPSTPPPDPRPLGDVTAAPRECDLISANSIKIATGLSEYRASGTKMDMGRRFASCSVREEGASDSSLGLLIEVFDPSPDDAEDLENTKLSTKGEDLPEALGPGFAARRKNAKDKTIAFVYGWTPDYERLLTVNIIEHAPGRDSLADATEFFRQLKPLLLDHPK